MIKKSFFANTSIIDIFFGKTKFYKSFIDFYFTKIINYFSILIINLNKMKNS